MNELKISHTHTFVLRPSGLCLGLPGWASTRTSLDFTEARDSEWQWHQLGHMQICTSPQTDNHTSTPPLSFLQAGCPSCRRTNSVKALKAVKISAICITTSHICMYFALSLCDSCTVLKAWCGHVLKAAWRTGSAVHRMNEVALRWARLALGWVTIFGRVYHLGM